MKTEAANSPIMTECKAVPLNRPFPPARCPSMLRSHLQVNGLGINGT